MCFNKITYADGKKKKKRHEEKGGKDNSIWLEAYEKKKNDFIF